VVVAVVLVRLPAGVAPNWHNGAIGGDDGTKGGEAGGDTQLGIQNESPANMKLRPYDPPPALESGISKERSMLDTSEKRRATVRWRCCSLRSVETVGRAWPRVEDAKRVSPLPSLETVSSVPSATV